MATVSIVLDPQGRELVIAENVEHPPTLTDLSTILHAGARHCWPGEPFQIRGRPGELYPLVAVGRDGETIYVH